MGFQGLLLSSTKTTLDHVKSHPLGGVPFLSNPCLGRWKGASSDAPKKNQTDCCTWQHRGDGTARRAPQVLRKDCEWLVKNLLHVQLSVCALRAKALKGTLLSEPRFSNPLRHAIFPMRRRENGHFQANPLKMAVFPVSRGENRMSQGVRKSGLTI